MKSTQDLLIELIKDFLESNDVAELLKLIATIIKDN